MNPRCYELYSLALLHRIAHLTCDGTRGLQQRVGGGSGGAAAENRRGLALAFRRSVQGADFDGVVSTRKKWGEDQAGGSTHLGAGTIMSDSGGLRLSTETLTHKNFEGAKKYMGVGADAGLDLTGAREFGRSGGQLDAGGQRLFCGGLLPRRKHKPGWRENAAALAN